jgi:hypothetical protein
MCESVMRIFFRLTLSGCKLGANTFNYFIISYLYFTLWPGNAAEPAQLQEALTAGVKR